MRSHNTELPTHCIECNCTAPGPIQSAEWLTKDAARAADSTPAEHCLTASAMLDCCCARQTTTVERWQRLVRMAVLLQGQVQASMVL